MANKEEINGNFDQKENLKEQNLIASGYLSETKVNLCEGDFMDLYESNFFGQPTNDVLTLDPEESALLLERGRIKVYKDDELINEIQLDDYINIVSDKDPDFWGKYLVYKDLRSRGYVVRGGYGELAPYRKYPRGARPNKAQSDTFVFPFAEGTFMELHQLDLIVAQAQSNRKTLILGMVDRSGDVTYYKASEFQIGINNEKIEWPNEAR